MEIKFKIKEGKLLQANVIDVNSGNVNMHICKFDIADNNDFMWFCVFKKGDGVYQQVIESGSCYIPKEVMETSGTFSIGCYGVDDGRRISTNWIELFVENGAYCEATAPKEPTPDVWETLVMNSLPYIDKNGNWFIYDKELKAYKDSGCPSRGEKGDKGNTGAKGADGRTPVLGVDYWTNADKTEVREAVERELNFEERLARVVGNAGNSLKNTVSGTVVAMNDVSPMEHILKVTVSGDETTDLTAVILKEYGRNILNYPELSKGKVENDGIVSISNDTQSAMYVSTPFITLPKGTYTFSVETLEISGQYGIFVQLGSATDWLHVVANINAQGKRTLTFTLEKATPVRILNEIRVNTALKFRIQINVGKEALPFEVYKNPTEYISDGEGTVSGVLVESPFVTLLADQDGITIKCQYNRDINKAYEELTNAIISLGGNV